jgi:hypothetical protein
MSLRQATLGIVGLCLLWIGVAGAASTPWTVYRDPANHFQIATPATWIRLPQLETKAARLQLANNLEAEGKTDEADLVRSLLPPKWGKPNPVFSAVEFPDLPGTGVTDCYVRRHVFPDGLRPDATILARFAQETYRGYKRDGVAMRGNGPVAIALKGGKSMLMYGVRKDTGLALYLLVGRDAFYSIGCRTDTSYLDSHTNLFRRIADTFRIT